MVLEELVRSLGEAIAATPTSGSISAFLFGSTVSGEPSPNDLDLLIIYSDADDCGLLRRSLNELVLPATLDILCMTASEERHYRFLDEVSARQLVQERFATSGRGGPGRGCGREREREAGNPRESR